VLTAWFGGSAEGARDVSIMSARRLPSGVWSTPRRIARVLEGFESHWNPVLFFNADRSKLWLHFKVRPTPTCHNRCTGGAHRAIVRAGVLYM
jgi:predicted neuraminidase